MPPPPTCPRSRVYRHCYRPVHRYGRSPVHSLAQSGAVRHNLVSGTVWRSPVHRATPHQPPGDTYHGPVRRGCRRPAGYDAAGPQAAGARRCGWSPGGWRATPYQPAQRPSRRRRGHTQRGWRRLGTPVRPRPGRGERGRCATPMREEPTRPAAVNARTQEAPKKLRVEEPTRPEDSVYAPHA